MRIGTLGVRLLSFRLIPSILNAIENSRRVFWYFFFGCSSSTKVFFILSFKDLASGAVPIFPKNMAICIEDCHIFFWTEKMTQQTVIFNHQKESKE